MKSKLGIHYNSHQPITDPATLKQIHEIGLLLQKNIRENDAKK